MRREETWLIIPGYRNYEVSDHGNVRRRMPGKATRVGRLVKINNGIYPQATISKGTESTKRTFPTHYLVCIAFRGPPPTDRHMVAHWDGNKQNCNLNNLRWATREENEADKIRRGTALRGSRHHQAILTEDIVTDLRKNYAASDKRRGTVTKLARRFDVSFKSAYHVLTRATWRHLP